MRFQMQLFANIIFKKYWFLTASKGLDGTKLFSLHLDAIENVFPKTNPCEILISCPWAGCYVFKKSALPDTTPGVK